MPTRSPPCDDVRRSHNRLECLPIYSLPPPHVAVAARRTKRPAGAVGHSVSWANDINWRTTTSGSPTSDSATETGSTNAFPSVAATWRKGSRAACLAMCLASAALISFWAFYTISDVIIAGHDFSGDSGDPITVQLRDDSPKRMPSDESAGTSDDWSLDSGFEACAHKEPSEGAMEHQQTANALRTQTLPLSLLCPQFNFKPKFLPHRVSTKDKSTQWEEIGHNDHTYSQSGPQYTFGKQKGLSSSLTKEDRQFYTGISKPVFDSLVKAVKIENSKTFLTLSDEDQLLLTLMRMRLGLLYGHLSRIFGISVFFPFLCILCNLCSRAQPVCVAQSYEDIVVVWLPRSLIRNSMPESFAQNAYEKTTCILDCSDVFLQRPKKLLARAQTYSSYKAHNTVKFLTAVAPNGYVMFVSRAYGGRASDEYIMGHCGVEDFLGSGDEVMADRGFVLSQYLDVQGVKLNVPSFTRGKSQLSESEVTQTRRIASVRIHVERAINRMKTFRIFKQALPIRL
ncbi:uncharacterized protein LOC119440263 [Dermacentor silvarum]|uniref:uncharacterized protein LOC119440263 n=1 Tax=Dermacentor silvarum TaxID=543639 RepID=UPI0021010F0C|nr:uncharacterized protein LOC119440263 [Dermacentor silvarum]